MIPESLLNRFKKENEILTIPEGEVILDFNKYIKNIPLIISGSVKVVAEDENGNETTLYHIKPGESCIMSIMGVLNDTESVVKAVTLEKTEIIFIKPSEVYKLVTEDKSWFEFIMNLYQTRFEELLTTVSRINFKSMEERIMDLLLQRSKVLHTKVVVITHQQIAAELGTAREVVSRGMKNLEKKNKLKIFRGKVVIK
jgi:CRP/FNR family transcriptional regulator, anaerobic regulatory protein